MDKFVCLKKSDVVIPTDGEEESSSGEDDGDDDEDDENEGDDTEDSDGNAPGTSKQEPVEVEEEVEAEEEDVSKRFNYMWQMLTCEIGFTRQSHTVFGGIEGHHSISRRRHQYSTSWGDFDDVLRQIS